MGSLGIGFTHFLDGVYLYNTLSKFVLLNLPEVIERQNI